MADGRGAHLIVENADWWRAKLAGLFENNLLLVAQFIAQQQLSGQAPVPMGDKRTPPWGVYDIFDTQDGGRVFVAVVSDANWQTFCQDFLPPGWSTDERLRTHLAQALQIG